jgi:LAO/AO transport system kinase
MQTNELLNSYFANDIRALAKILTIVESRGADLEDIMSKIVSKETNSYCIGITGPPGAGKSTIVDKLTHILRKEGSKVGIVAIDPSSPFSGGAVLGDRIRMQDHAGDEGVFIRSLGSRGSHGGLSRATRDIVRVMSGFGFDYIIVETVGVGQTELDIMELADTTAVILVPEAGDTIQTMKAGLLEIADIFVINKSDRPGADGIRQGLTALVEMSGGKKWKIPVIKTDALRTEGIEELYSMIMSHKDFLENDPKRREHKAKIREAEVVQITIEQFEKVLTKKINSRSAVATLVEKVKVGKENPYTAASNILQKIIK